MTTGTKDATSSAADQTGDVARTAVASAREGAGMQDHPESVFGKWGGHPGELAACLRPRAVRPAAGERGTGRRGSRPSPRHGRRLIPAARQARSSNVPPTVMPSGPIVNSRTSVTFLVERAFSTVMARRTSAPSRRYCSSSTLSERWEMP